MRQRRTPLLGALAVVLAVTAHVNALNDPFVWDDVKGVQENVSIESLSRPLAIVRHNVTRPLVNFPTRSTTGSGGDGARSGSMRRISRCIWRTSPCCSPSCGSWCATWGGRGGRMPRIGPI